MKLTGRGAAIIVGCSSFVPVPTRLPCFYMKLLPTYFTQKNWCFTQKNYFFTQFFYNQLMACVYLGRNEAFVVGMTGDLPLLDYMAAAGMLVGFNVALMNAIAEKQTLYRLRQTRACLR